MVSKLMANIPKVNLKYEPSTFQDRTAYLQKNYNWSVLSNYTGQLSNSISNFMKEYDQRFNDQIHKTPQPSEVVDARMDSYGYSWATLKDRIDSIEQNTTRFKYSGGNSKAISVLELRDLSTKSNNFSYEKIKSLAKINIGATGWASTTVANLSTQKID